MGDIGLTQGERDALRWYTLYGQTITEVAKHLGLSRYYVRQLLDSGCRKLYAAWIEAEYPTEKGDNA